MPLHSSGIKSSTSPDHNYKRDFSGLNRIVCHPIFSLRSHTFSCFATSSLIYSLSSLSRGTLESRFIPTSHLRHTRWEETALTAKTRMHTQGGGLSSIRRCLYTKQGFQTGDDSAVACSHPAPFSPSHSCPTHTHTLIHLLYIYIYIHYTHFPSISFIFRFSVLYANKHSPSGSPGSVCEAQREPATRLFPLLLAWFGLFSQYDGLLHPANFLVLYFAARTQPTVLQRWQAWKASSGKGAAVAGSITSASHLSSHIWKIAVFPTAGPLTQAKPKYLLVWESKGN